MQLPRVCIAGTGSGCGKTTVACALLQTFQNRGLTTRAAKCGPDYIDPMFHSRIIGAESCNLDSFFLQPDVMNYLLSLHGGDITVIEGVMGYYDGLGLDTTRASTYEVARITKTPVILTVNARGAALSVLAVVQGFLDFLPDSGIRGVIFNQCSAMTYPVLAKELERRFPGIRACGYLPPMPECRLESRHLGLVTAGEIENWQEKLSALSAQAEKSLNLGGILEIAGQAEPVCVKAPELPRFSDTVRIAVARDAAFCFYYEDSLGLLKNMGAEMVPFSPMEDEKLPENIQGLYLGGGYPELYADKLSANRAMRDSVAAALKNGLPCIAECGGFMYLTQAIDGKPMAGVLPGTCRDMGKLVRFGYVTLTARKDNLLCTAGESIPAHEFHHWDAEQPGEDFLAEKPSGRHWNCIHAGKTLYAGYPHIHLYANPSFGVRFYKACLKEKEKQLCRNK